MTVLPVGKERNCMPFDQTYQVSRNKRHLFAAQESSTAKPRDHYNCTYFFCFFSFRAASGKEQKCYLFMLCQQKEEVS